jgi:signal peptidase I
MAWWIRVTVVGQSMSPTLRDGQRLLARRLRRNPRRGEVIVFRVPEDEELPCRIKRVAAIAGDPVPDWLTPTLPELARIPAGSVAVVGDNPRSQDSRQLGLVDCHDIVGAVPWS